MNIEEKIIKANELAEDDDNEAWDYFDGNIVYDNGEDIVIRLPSGEYVGWKNNRREWCQLKMVPIEYVPDWIHGTIEIHTIEGY